MRVREARSLCDPQQCPHCRKAALWRRQQLGQSTRSPSLSSATCPHATVPTEVPSSVPALTGDISNSWHHPDDNPPVFSKGYTIYTYNYLRTAAQSIHNHGHQRESEFIWASLRQDQSEDLFRGKFVGWVNQTSVPGRRSDTHNPPNSRHDYDYENSAPVASDCEDWKPKAAHRRRSRRHPGATSPTVGRTAWLHRAARERKRSITFTGAKTCQVART